MIGDLCSENLFERALIEPAFAGGTELYVVSGYASSAMVVRHFEELRKRKLVVSLDLQIGMTSREGLPEPALEGFRSIRKQIPFGKVQSRFNIGPPFHSKLYVWCMESGPFQAFLGSANYTQSAFGIGSAGRGQLELLTEVDPSQAFEHVLQVSGASITPDDPDVERLIRISKGYEGEWFSLKTDDPSGVAEEVEPGESHLLPLVQTTKSPGEVHNAGAGLNWGHRGKRNPSEAYIPVPSEIRKLDFFPNRGVRFQIFTDTGESFVATISQDGGKAIETPENNALIGEYFRRKLGLLPGDFVTTESLRKFGSTAVKFTKVSEELFLMNFEPGMLFEI